MKWQDKLSKSEMKHLKSWVGTTLTAVKTQSATHAKSRREPEWSGVEPCYICKSIARKLGLPV